MRCRTCPCVPVPSRSETVGLGRNRAPRSRRRSAAAPPHERNHVDPLELRVQDAQGGPDQALVRVHEPGVPPTQACALISPPLSLSANLLLTASLAAHSVEQGVALCQEQEEQLCRRGASLLSCPGAAAPKLTSGLSSSRTAQGPVRASATSCPRSPCPDQTSAASRPCTRSVPLSRCPSSSSPSS